MEYDFYKSNNKYFTTMKKTLFYLAALVCCIATGMAFTSCGDDEPDVTANATYSITFGENFFDAVDGVVIYYKDNGKIKFETVNSGTSWQKSVSGKLPSEFGFQWRFQPKDESSLTEETYNLFTTATIALAFSNGAGVTQSIPIISNAATKKSDVVKTIQNASGKSFGYKVSSRGDATRSDNLDYKL